MTEPGQDDHLEAAFAALRADPPVPPEALVQRVAAMGAAEMPRAVATAAMPEAVQRGGFAHLFGGWRLASGFASAAVVGFAVGLSGAVDLSPDAGDGVDLMPDLIAPFTADEED